MYGTVARFHLKPGVAAQLLTRLRELNVERDPGLVAEFVYHMDAEPDVYYMAVAYESKEVYRANSTRPQTQARYVELMKFTAAEPEWHDGEIVFTM